MAELQSLGALAPNARKIATHFRHNGAALCDELTEYFTPHGIEVAYDGMVVEV
jgi:phosphoribosyl 1,2-cyclic phosphate phosphodiesterase